MNNEPTNNQDAQGADNGLLTLTELAGKLKMHPDTVRGLWRRRVLPGLRIGHRTLRFDYSAVLAALKQADAAPRQ